MSGNGVRQKFSQSQFFSTAKFFLFGCNGKTMDNRNGKYRDCEKCKTSTLLEAPCLAGGKSTSNVRNTPAKTSRTCTLVTVCRRYTQLSDRFCPTITRPDNRAGNSVCHQWRTTTEETYSVSRKTERNRSRTGRASTNCPSVEQSISVGRRARNTGFSNAGKIGKNRTPFCIVEKNQSTTGKKWIPSSSPNSTGGGTCSPHLPHPLLPLLTRYRPIFWLTTSMVGDPVNTGYLGPGCGTASNCRAFSMDSRALVKNSITLCITDNEVCHG